MGERDTYTVTCGSVMGVLHMDRYGLGVCVCVCVCVREGRIISSDLRRDCVSGVCECVCVCVCVAHASVLKHG